MLIVRTIVCVALLALCTGALSQPPFPTPPKGSNPPKESAGQGGAESANKQSGTDNAPFVVKLQNTGKSPGDAQREQRQEDEKASRERWLLILTGVAAIAGTILAIITGLLAAYTYKLWRATSTLVGDAKDTAKRQLRAYVSVRSLDSVELIVAPDSVDDVHLVPRLENSGATPTKHMMSSTNWKWFKDGVIPSGFDYPERREKTGIAFMGPKTIIAGEAAVLPRTTIDHIAAKSGRLLVWGWVDYDDVFKNSARHRTEFCYEITVIEKRDEPERFHLSNRFYGPHNGADDECYRQPQPFTPPT